MSDEIRFEEKEFSNTFDYGIWKKIFGMAHKLYPFMALVAFFMIVVATMEGFMPLLTRYAIDHIVPVLGSELGSRLIIRFAVIYGILALIQGINVFLFIFLAGIVEVRICHTLREHAFKRLQVLSFSYYDKTPAGWIMSRMTSDAQRLSDTIAWGLVDLVWGSTMMLVIVVFMFSMHWQLALLSLSFVPFLLVATFFFQKKILHAQRKARKANSLLSGLYSEGLQGARTSKTLVLEEYNCVEFSKQSEKLKSYALRSARLSALFMPIVIILGASGASLALGGGGSLVVQGALTLGTLVAFLNYSMMFFDPAREVARVLSEFQAAQASAERLMALIETSPEIVDREDAIADGDIIGSLEMKGVGFHYGDGTWIVRNFNLCIPAGQTIAIVGETGSGKSTLVNLLCRFYEPVEGDILIDGNEYRTRTQQWLHSKLGYVLQTPLLFSGTIRENIRYGRLEASDSDIEEAARNAHALGFIQELEDGFETIVGEGGVLLSGGQKQLISLARALVADPRIMILDEATSSVDTECEVLIQRAIDQILSDRTSIIIAHRLSTIRKADRILVMDKGLIIEDGEHDSLMRQKGRYWQLYTRQYLDEDLLEAASRIAQ